jgi:hypothetical protein
VGSWLKQQNGKRGGKAWKRKVSAVNQVQSVQRRPRLASSRRTTRASPPHSQAVQVMAQAVKPESASTCPFLRIQAERARHSEEIVAIVFQARR